MIYPGLFMLSGDVVVTLYLELTFNPLDSFFMVRGDVSTPRSAISSAKISAHFAAGPLCDDLAVAAGRCWLLDRRSARMLLERAMVRANEDRAVMSFPGEHVVTSMTISVMFLRADCTLLSREHWTVVLAERVRADWMLFLAVPLCSASMALSDSFASWR